MKCPKETIFASKFSDDTYEYRLITLCEIDFLKLPDDYRRYYQSNCKERIATQEAYLVRQE